jgi:hypothetical protein
MLLDDMEDIRKAMNALDDCQAFINHTDETFKLYGKECQQEIIQKLIEYLTQALQS